MKGAAWKTEKHRDTDNSRVRFRRVVAVYCRGKAGPFPTEEEAESWCRVLREISRTQTLEVLLQYAQTISRLCVHRIVLALVKPGKFYCGSRRGGECAYSGRFLFRGFSQGFPGPHQKHGRDCALFLCRDRNRGKEGVIK